MFAEIDANKDDKIDESEFIAFFGKCDKVEKSDKPADEKSEEASKEGDGDAISEDDLSRLFAALDDDKQGYLAKDLIVSLLRKFMKIAKETVITSDMSIKESKTLRRLELGEVVEILKGPIKEETVEVMRVQCRVMKDEVEGWITMSGNSGTMFLEDGGNLFKVVKETILTPEFELDAGTEKATRKLKQGEILEVREWPKKEEKSGLMRMKCKAKSDGVVGWVTSVGNAGATFLEAC